MPLIGACDTLLQPVLNFGADACSTEHAVMILVTPVTIFMREFHFELLSCLEFIAQISFGLNE
jgi:hypothetical protein